MDKKTGQWEKVQYIQFIYSLYRISITVAESEFTSRSIRFLKIDDVFIIVFILHDLNLLVFFVNMRNGLQEDTMLAVLLHFSY